MALQYVVTSFFVDFSNLCAEIEIHIERIIYNYVNVLEIVIHLYIYKLQLRKLARN